MDRLKLEICTKVCVFTTVGLYHILMSPQTEATWAKLDHMENENKKIKELLERKNQTIAELESTNEDLQSRVDEQRDMINKKQDAVRAIDEKLGATREEKEVLEGRVGDLEADLENIKVQQVLPQERRIKELQAQISTWETKYNNLMIANNENSKIRQNLGNQLDAQVKLYHDCLDVNRDMKAEIQAMKDEITDKAEKLKNLEDQIALCDKREHEIQKDKDAANAAVEKLKEDLVVALAAKESAVKELEDIRTVRSFSIERIPLTDDLQKRTSKIPDHEGAEALVASTPLSSVYNTPNEEAASDGETSNGECVPATPACPDTRKESSSTTMTVREVRIHGGNKEADGEGDEDSGAPSSVDLVQKQLAHTPRGAKGSLKQQAAVPAPFIAISQVQRLAGHINSPSGPPKGFRTPTRIRHEPDTSQHPETPQLQRRRRTRQFPQESPQSRPVLPPPPTKRTFKRKMQSMEHEEEDTNPKPAATPAKPAQDQPAHSNKKAKTNKKNGRK